MNREDIAGKKVYIAGKITGLDRAEVQRKFGAAEKLLRELGAIPFNPLCLPEGLDWEDYMPICLMAIQACDAVYLLDNWRDSKGAKVEWAAALVSGQEIYQQGK